MGIEEAKLREQGQGLEKIDALLQVLACLPRLRELCVFPSGYSPGRMLQPGVKTTQLLVNLAKRGRVNVRVLESHTFYQQECLSTT